MYSFGLLFSDRLTSTFPVLIERRIIPVLGWSCGRTHRIVCVASPANVTRRTHPRSYLLGIECYIEIWRLHVHIEQKISLWWALLNPICHVISGVRSMPHGGLEHWIPPCKYEGGDEAPCTAVHPPMSSMSKQINRQTYAFLSGSSTEKGELL